MRSFLPSRKSPRHCWKGQSCHSLNESRRGAAPAELTGYPSSGTSQELAIQAPGRTVHRKVWGSLLQNQLRAARGSCWPLSAGEDPCVGSLVMKQMLSLQDQGARAAAHAAGAGCCRSWVLQKPGHLVGAWEENTGPRKTNPFLLHCLPSALYWQSLALPRGKSKICKGSNLLFQSRWWRMNLELGGNTFITGTCSIKEFWALSSTYVYLLMYNLHAENSNKFYIINIQQKRETTKII